MLDTLPGHDQPVAVFVHVHYPEIWAEISALLAARLNVPFRLILTYTDPNIELTAPGTPNLISVDRLMVENRGRDIRPFLMALQQASAFDIGLKLHTKKSPQREDGAQWRAALLDSLLPATGANLIVSQLHCDPRIGLVAPADFCFSIKPWILRNEPGMVGVAAVLGSELTENDLEDAYFASGSMFWFRRKAVDALAIDQLLALFEPEQGQLDGTIAHAVERMFPIAAKWRGFVSMAVPALIASTPDSKTDTLATLARKYVDIATSHFPGPCLQENNSSTPTVMVDAQLGRLRLLLNRYRK